MKFRNISKLTVLGLIVTASAIGCKSTRPVVTPLAGKTSDASNSGQAEIGKGSLVNPDDKPIADGNGLIPQGDHQSRNNWNADASVFKNFTVHFAYDSSVIPANEKSNLEAVANQLKTAPSSVALRVEGHCDERGTEE